MMQTLLRRCKKPLPAGSGAEVDVDPNSSFSLTWFKSLLSSPLTGAAAINGHGCYLHVEEWEGWRTKMILGSGTEPQPQASLIN